MELNKVNKGKIPSEDVLSKVCVFSSIVLKIGSNLSFSRTLAEEMIAFDWAIYCRALERQLTNYQSRFNFEKKLVEAGQTRIPAASWRTDLTFMKYSVDRLMEAFIHNPSISEDKLEKLIRTYSEDLSEPLCTLKAAREYRLRFQQLRGCLDSLITLLRTEYAKKPSAHKDPLVQSALRKVLEAAALWQEASHRSIWFHMAFCEMLDRLTKCPHGWSMLVCALSVVNLGRVERERRPSVLEVLRIVREWIVFQEARQGLLCPVWEVCSMLMTQSAVENVMFRDWYLRLLEKHVDSLDAQSLSVTQPFMRLTDGGDGETPPELRCLRLVRRFQHLLSADYDTKQEAMTLLLSKTGAGVTWRQLTKEVITLFSS